MARQPKSCAADFCSTCGRRLVPLKQLVFEYLAEGESVSGAARHAKCSRQYVQKLRAAAQLALLPVDSGACSRPRR